MTPYRNKEELKYIGSDLNKFVYENCRRDMYVMNIDLVQYRKFQNKKVLRFIESKHVNERIPEMQKTVLKVIAQAFRFLNKKVFSNIDFELYLVTSSPPYEDSSVYDIIRREKVKLNKGELIEFFNFTYQWPEKKKHYQMADTV